MEKLIEKAVTSIGNFLAELQCGGSSSYACGCITIMAGFL